MDNIQNREKPSLAARIFGPVLLISMTIFSFAWFFYSAFILFNSMLSEIIVVEKGTFYLFGCGVSSLSLTFAYVQEFWVGVVLTKKQSSILTKLVLAGIFLIFVFPLVFNFTLRNLLLERGYSVCDKVPSYRWSIYRDVVYIKPPLKCTEDVLKLNQKESAN